MSEAFYTPRFQALDANGDPVPGAKLAFYATGTSTPATTYSDFARTIPASNPVVADSGGLFPLIWLATATTYKAVLSDADNVVIWTVDPVN